MLRPLKRWYVYALIDPTTGKRRYVGRTINIERRLRRHCNESSKFDTHLGRWLRQLLVADLRPTMEILDVGSGRGYVAAEQAWMNEMRDRGEPLTNTATAASGGSGPCSDATRKKISQARLGKKRPESFRQRMREIALARPSPSAETRKRMSEARKGTLRSEETKARMREAAKRRPPVSDRTKAKIRASRLGRTRAMDVNAKIARWIEDDE